MPNGLPARVTDPQWKSWLESAPVAAGTTLLDAMRVSRYMRQWLTEVPPPQLISPTERREIGNDLLHLCDQLAEEVRARNSSGGIAVLVTFGGTLGALMFPPAAPAIALGTMAAGGAFAANAYDQKRRQDELDEAIKLARRLAWSLRT